MNSISTIALKTVLVLFGIFGLFLSLDFGLGGFETLGWQGSIDFLEVIDESRYGIQDSHFRFVGGVFAVIGLMMIVSVTNLPKYREALNFIFVLIFVGGLMRFASGNFDVLFDEKLMTALIAELVLTPMLYFWLRHEVKMMDKSTMTVDESKHLSYES